MNKLKSYAIIIALVLFVVVTSCRNDQKIERAKLIHSIDSLKEIIHENETVPCPACVQIVEERRLLLENEMSGDSVHLDEWEEDL